MSTFSAIFWAFALAAAAIAGVFLCGWSSVAKRPFWQNWLAWAGYFGAVLGTITFGVGASIAGILCATLLGGPAMSAVALFLMWQDFWLIGHVADREALEKRRFRRAPPRDLGSPPHDD